MNGREMLVKELYFIVNKHLKHMGCVQTISLPIMIGEIEDVILEDRKRIVEPLVKCKKNHLGKNYDSRNGWCVDLAIDETLKNANIEG